MALIFYLHHLIIDFYQFFSGKIFFFSCIIPMY